MPSTPNSCSPTSYSPPAFDSEIKLQLSRNETVSTLPPGELAKIPDLRISQYPSMERLQSAIGNWLAIDPTRVVVSAGGDDALDRVIRLAMQTGASEILTHTPSFEMVDIYTQNNGGLTKKTTWKTGPFPTNEFVRQIHSNTGLVIVVSPNNPTGLTVPATELIKIADAAQLQGAYLLVDNAYIEFADEDYSNQLFDHSNILVLRTFSKAWGMAGLRTGYLIAPDAVTASRYRTASGPFPVSGLSLQLAERAILHTPQAMHDNVAIIKHFREELILLLRRSGIETGNSQGNFVLMEHPDANKIWQQLAENGIATRIFPNSPWLKNSLRITVPTTATDLLHLAKSLTDALNADFDPTPIAVTNESAPPPLTQPPKNQPPTKQTDRTSQVKRTTKETAIEIDLNLDGTGVTSIGTGIGFLDHMLTALAFHSRFDLALQCRGDLHIDDHHTAEDCALALGSAIDQALGPRTGIVRFGYAYAPLDEALARTVIDLSGRPWPNVDLKLKREMVGTIATENLTHFFISLAMSLKCSLHIDVLRGDNDHHRAESAFKSLALALKKSVTRTAGAVPSTKGVL